MQKFMCANGYKGQSLYSIIILRVWELSESCTLLPIYLEEEEFYKIRPANKTDLTHQPIYHDTS